LSKKVEVTKVDNIADVIQSIKYDYAFAEPVKPRAAPTRIVTEVAVGDKDALYIYAPNDGMPPARFGYELKQIHEQFKQVFPDMTIIVGAVDLKFTQITKKQVFKGKLDGTFED